MEIDKEQWLYSLEIIKNSKMLRESFEKEFDISFNFKLIKESFNANLLKGTIINRVECIGTICFEINGKIFLQGEIKEGFDIIGEGNNDQDLIELFDMTTEMENGQSYSFYTSTTTFFQLAKVEDCVKVNEWLKSLR